jgi:tRNA(fMet)-specific endonuclease VapC
VGASNILSADKGYGRIEACPQFPNDGRPACHLDWPNGAGPVYGSISRHLKEKGTPVGAMDLLITAHALFVGAVLVTDNTREFERVPSLNLENWIDR